MLIDSEHQLIEGLHSSVKPNEKITALHIRNISLVRLEVNIPEWRYLMSLSITDGNITQILGILESAHISCLNLSSNYIQETDPLLISELANLVRLDMSNNNMTLVPTLSPSLLKFEIDLSSKLEITSTSTVVEKCNIHPSYTDPMFNHLSGPVVPRNHISLLDLDEVEFIYKLDELQIIGFKDFKLMRVWDREKKPIPVVSVYLDRKHDKNKEIFDLSRFMNCVVSVEPIPIHLGKNFELKVRAHSQAE
ncbi:uncharacterized protein LOC103515768 [Diaphorina citri]|uniref:Uncharacterized protein LOC103515768 n=1 Tax=Diaphorina citri TaxID=121845 RepID=A0A3Q0JB41_DIACI|nr:uncharacterized protein LOC103515768 [Diaphorina citri]